MNFQNQVENTKIEKPVGSLSSITTYLYYKIAQIIIILKSECERVYKRSRLRHRSQQKIDLWATYPGIN